MIDTFEGTFTLCFKGEFIPRRKVFSKHLVPLFEFNLDDGTPMAFRAADGLRLKPNRTFARYDFGSVPLVLQSLVSPLCSPRGFACHDSFYQFHGCWEAHDGEDRWTPMTRRQADDLLRRMMRAEGCTGWTAFKAWLAVRVGGSRGWDRGLIKANQARMASIRQREQGTRM